MAERDREPGEVAVDDGIASMDDMLPVRPIWEERIKQAKGQHTGIITVSVHAVYTLQR